MVNNDYATMSHFDLVETLIAVQAEIKRREDIHAAVDEINAQLNRLYELTYQSEKLTLETPSIKCDITDMLMGAERLRLDVKFARMI